MRLSRAAPLSPHRCAPHSADRALVVLQHQRRLDVVAEKTRSDAAEFGVKAKTMRAASAHPYFARFTLYFAKFRGLRPPPKFLKIFRETLGYPKWRHV